MALAGELTIYTAEEDRAALCTLGQEYARFQVDLSQITECDSAGLQLLLAWQRDSEAAEQDFKITQISAPVQTMLEVYRLNHLIATAND